MELFLTGAETYLANQKNGYESLGGFQSIVGVPNGRLDFLFADISLMTQKRNLSEYIAIILRNTSGATKTNVKLKYIYDYKFKTAIYQAKLEVAAVTLTGGQRMEKIGNRYSEPFSASFHEASFRRADIIMTVVTAGSVGNTVTVFGVTTAALTSTSTENIIDALVVAFSGNATYTAIKISTTQIYFQLKATTVVSTAPGFSTTGGATVTFSSVTLTNDYNNEVTISASMADGVGIGIWLKRSLVDPIVKRTNQEVYDDFVAGTIPNKNEDIEFIISYT